MSSTGHPQPGGYGGRAPGPFEGKEEAVVGVWYREINADQEPFSTGMDPTGRRVMFQFNVSIVKAPSDTLKEEIAQRFQDQSVGIRNTNIFIGPKKEIPTGDGPYLLINETGGGPPSWIHNQDLPFMKNPSIQVTVVALSYNNAMDMVLNAYDALVSVKNTYLNLE